MWKGKGASFLLSASLLSTTAQAYAFWTPRQTASVVVPLDAQSPRPTHPPGLHELLRRQNSAAVYTYSVGPDNTCGYISGLPGELLLWPRVDPCFMPTDCVLRQGAPYACERNDATCIFILVSSNLPGAVACCDTDCTARLACRDFDEIFSSSRCNDQCLVDTFTVKWYDTPSFLAPSPLASTAAS
jgi:hypothetical protein